MITALMTLVSSTTPPSASLYRERTIYSDLAPLGRYSRQAADGAKQPFIRKRHFVTETNELKAIQFPTGKGSKTLSVWLCVVQMPLPSIEIDGPIALQKP
jgi:hypothetical protein